MKWLFSLLVAAVLASLLYTLWSVNRDAAAELSPSPEAGLPAVAEPVPPEPEALETGRAPAPVSEPVLEPIMETAPTEAAAKPQEPRESWRAIQKLLEDQELLDASARPTETATAELKELVTKVEAAIQGEVAEVAQARVEAGHFDRIPGYVQGDKVKWPNSKDSLDLYRSFVGTETGDAGWVVLERADHPELYALSDRMKLLKAELRARERAR